MKDSARWAIVLTFFFLMNLVWTVNGLFNGWEWWNLLSGGIAIAFGIGAAFEIREYIAWRKKQR